VVPPIGSKVKRRRSLKRTLFYASIPTILAFLFVEGLFRLYFLVCGDELFWEYQRLSHHPAYMSKPWFSREFLASSRSAPGGFYTPKGLRIWVPIDYKDRFITIRDGIRATVGFDPGAMPPNRRPRKLFLIGGSTTYCDGTAWLDL
jgi:hypothetical protein